MVRAQGGTEAAVRLGPVQPRLLPPPAATQLGIDSGFVAQGYFMPCFTDGRGRRRRTTRIAMQQALGLDVRWVDADEFDALNPAMAPGLTLGASYAAGRRLHRPAAQRARLHRGALHAPASRCASAPRSPGCDVDGGRVVGVRHLGRRRSPPSGSCSPAARTLAAVGRGGRRADPGRRRAPPGRGHRAAPGPRAPTGCRWSSTWRPGIYWRPEEGGVLWGMSNPDEPPGEATRVRLTTTSRGCARRVAELVPVDRASSGCARRGRPPSTSRPTTCRSSARCSAPTGRSPARSWPPPAATG